MTAARPTRTEVPDKLMKLFLTWQNSQQRLQQAQQTLVGAQGQAIADEAAFKGVAGYLYGPEVTFEFTDGKLAFDPHGNPAGSNGDAKVVEMTPKQLQRAIQNGRAKR